MIDMRNCYREQRQEQCDGVKRCWKSRPWVRDEAPFLGKLGAFSMLSHLILRAREMSTALILKMRKPRLRKFKASKVTHLVIRIANTYSVVTIC